MNTLVNFPVVKVAHSAPGPSQRKDVSPGVADCYHKEYKLKYVKSVSCVTQLSCVKPVTNVPNVISNLPVGARLQNFWQTWLDLGAGLKVVQILREGYTLPFWIQPKLSRSPTVISCYANPHRNLYLLEALNQLIDKNAVELSSKLKFSGIFQPAFPGTKTQQQMEADIRSKQSKPVPKGREIQNGDTGNHQSLPPARGVGYLSRLQGCLFPNTHTGTIQEIQIFHPRQVISVQGTAIRTVHGSYGVHYNSKGSHTDGHIQGYKDPPIPKRLVGESQIPPGLYPTYTGTNRIVSQTGLVGEFGEIGTGTQASF